MGAVWSRWGDRPAGFSLPPLRDPMSKPVIRSAAPADLDVLLPLVAAYHAFEGADSTGNTRHAAAAHLPAEPPRAKGPSPVRGFI